jgi:hypothetical protein
MLGEWDADGLRTIAPDPFVYCPREKRIMPAADHAGCEHFGGHLVDMTGDRAGVYCKHPTGRLAPTI